MNARLVKSQERIQELERKIQSFGKGSDKITPPAWPTPQGFARWRESVLAVTVAASADKSVAVKFVGEVDDPHMDLAALLTKRSEEFTSIDSKLFAAILNILPKNEDGYRIHVLSKEHARATAVGKQSGYSIRTSNIKDLESRKRTSQHSLCFIWKAGSKDLARS